MDQGKKGKEIVISDDSEEEDERNNSPLDCSHEVVCAYAFKGNVCFSARFAFWV